MTTAIVAVDRPSLVKAHVDVASWVEQRLERNRVELREVEVSLTQARDRKWATTSIANQVRRLKAHETFLNKVRGAIEAGYTIIPNFDLTLLAVRTDKNAPRAEDRSVPTVAAVRLPAGHGEYVSPEPEFESWTIEETGPDNKKRNDTVYRATAHAPVDVPFVLIKQGLAERLHEAMKERLFDEIGIVEHRRDPVLVGRILHPEARQWDRRGIAFFIGWWFNMQDLEG